MIEFMHLEDYSAERIAVASGLPLEDVQQVISKRPSFDTAFEYAMHLLIRNPKEAGVQLQLIPKPDRKYLKESSYCPARLEGPFRVSSLLRQPAEKFAHDGLLVLTREQPG